MTPPGPQRRRPGDGDDFGRRPDPNADFLGAQSSAGNSAGPLLAVNRLVRWLLTRRRGGS